VAVSSTIIFLDIDGPLLSHRAKQHPRNQIRYATGNTRPLPDPIDWGFVKAPKGTETIRYFDELAVQLVMNLLNGYDAQLVISSSWQKAGLANIRFILEENGIPASRLHAFWKTELELQGATRAEQIGAWLDAAAARAEEITAYAALDDDPSVTTLPGGILISYAEGLRWSDFCSASAALGGGIVISDVQHRHGKLVGNVSKGKLGEAPVFAHGVRTRELELGPVGDSFGPAPTGCIRLRHSDYQLVRVDGPLP